MACSAVSSENVAPPTTSIMHSRYASCSGVVWYKNTLRARGWAQGALARQGGGGGARTQGVAGGAAGACLRARQCCRMGARRGGLRCSHPLTQDGLVHAKKAGTCSSWSSCPAATSKPAALLKGRCGRQARKHTTFALVLGLRWPLAPTCAAAAWTPGPPRCAARPRPCSTP